jgi:ubiquinone/menaquinone biosynthesis C-methylase UbiE
MEKLVVRVNELFHDLTNKEYKKTTFCGMFNYEKERWSRIDNFIVSDKPLKILDVGTGTGLVPLIVGDKLKREDTFYCSDVSEKILDSAKISLEQEKYKCNFEFVKLDKYIPFKNESIDVITVNSVLHHIPDTGGFLKEVDRVLKKNGVLVIGHEPNVRFIRNRALWLNQKIVMSLMAPQEMIKDLIRNLNLDGFVNSMFASFSQDKKNEIDRRKKIVKEINDKLRSEDLVKKNLSYKEIIGLVDYKAEYGFDPYNLMPRFDLLYIETYNHSRGLVSLYPKNNFIRRYEKKLSMKYPKDGRTFFAVFKK